VHFHIASRKYVFPMDKEDKATLEAMGYEVNVEKPRSGQEAKDYKVSLSVDWRDLLGMWRKATGQRNRPGDDRKRFEIKELDIRRIDYESPCSAALYLADFYLFYGCRRSLRQPDRYPLVDNRIITPLEADLLIYGPELQLELDVAAALDRSEQPEDTALALLKEAAGEVNISGNAERGFRKAGKVMELLERGDQQPSLNAQVLWLQTQLSHANHSADLERAQNVWEQYESLEPKLYELREVGLQLKAAMRNRRAVHLTDHMDYQLAKTILAEVVSSRKRFLDGLANQFQTTRDKLPDQELAECYGSRGQVNAFLGDFDEAKKDFRRALRLFKKPQDRERQWVYLGHLACDHASSEAGKKLWKKVVAKLDIDTSKPTVRHRGQYLLALQLKGIHEFSDVSDLKQFAVSLSNTSLNRTFPPDEMNEHPFGLIHQALAMIYQRALEAQLPPPKGKDWLVEAREAYDLAIGQMDNFGTELFTFLAWLARLRRSLMISKSGGKGARAKAKEVLRNLLISPPEYAKKPHFNSLQGDMRHSDDQTRGVAWTRSVRFQYW
jgi:tetratricopeptide (TPR) repeat protein